MDSDGKKMRMSSKSYSKSSEGAEGTLNVRKAIRFESKGRGGIALGRGGSSARGRGGKKPMRGRRWCIVRSVTIVLYTFYQHLQLFAVWMWYRIFRILVCDYEGPVDSRSPISWKLGCLTSNPSEMSCKTLVLFSQRQQFSSTFKSPRNSPVGVLST